jgi:hypothetical protein
MHEILLSDDGAFENSRKDRANEKTMNAQMIFRRIVLVIPSISSFSHPLVRR